MAIGGADDIPTPDDDGRRGPHDFDATGMIVKDRPRRGFGLRAIGARMRLCPTGDCKQVIIDISGHHLIEHDPTGNATKNFARNFGLTLFNWTAPSSKTNEDGVNVTTSSTSATLAVNGATSAVTFKSEVSYFDGNTTAKNGEQLIDIPGGALKFAVWIENWPFLADGHTLHLGYRAIVRSRKGGKPRRRQQQGRDRKVDRLELAEDLFLDSPALAQIDGAMVQINTSLVVTPRQVIIDYAFPKFKTLYYDPVMTDEARNEGDGAASRSTPVPTTSSADSLRVYMAVNAVFVVLAVTMA
ncbi:hypothetical protein ATCC90586_000668 [Pythium insidiosum]|nr:hypothetical protein ATCC90586_000668 [Pythium insidiosum]